MANWTTATLLKRLATKLAARPDATFDADDLIENPAVLGEMPASEIIEALKVEIVREAMR